MKVMVSRVQKIAWTFSAEWRIFSSGAWVGVPSPGPECPARLPNYVSGPTAFHPWAFSLLPFGGDGVSIATFPLGSGDETMLNFSGRLARSAMLAIVATMAL